MPADPDVPPPRRHPAAYLLRLARVWLRGGWRAVREIEPEFWAKLRSELLAWRQWADRAIVLACAALTVSVDID